MKRAVARIVLSAVVACSAVSLAVPVAHAGTIESINEPIIQKGMNRGTATGAWYASDTAFSLLNIKAVSYRPLMPNRVYRFWTVEVGGCDDGLGNSVALTRRSAETRVFIGTSRTVSVANNTMRCATGWQLGGTVMSWLIIATDQHTVLRRVPLLFAG